MRISPKSGGQQHSIQMTSRDSSIRMLMLDVLLVSTCTYVILFCSVGIGLVLRTLQIIKLFTERDEKDYKVNHRGAHFGPYN